MHVRDVMTRDAHFCTPNQSANDAARAMWDFDIGCVPVVGEGHVPIGMVTDRDICMATYLQGKAPCQIPILQVMSSRIVVCRESHSLTEAEHMMKEWQVRRLPVVDDAGKLIGMLSLNDIVLAGVRSPIAKAKQRLKGDVNDTLAAVCRHREARSGIQF